MSVVRLRVVGVVLVLAGVLAGCTSDPKPPPFTPSPPPSTSSASPTPTPSRTGPLTTGPNVRPGEKPPVLSKFAKQHTKSGALAFATYFIKALDWSIATNDPYLIKEISAATCKACQRYIKGIDTLRGAGSYEKGGRITIQSERLVTGTFKVKSDYVVEFKLTESSTTVVTHTAPPSTSPPTTLRSLVAVSWRAGGWLVLGQGAPS